MKPALAPLALLLALAACDDAPTDPAGAIGVEWRLESLRRPDASAVTVDPARYSLRLEAGGAARVRSDCNSCSGGYTLAGPVLAMGPLACTRAFCGTDSLDPEYPLALEGELRVHLEERRLGLTGTRGTLDFVR
jgi:heat shock protein HslJ